MASFGMGGSMFGGSSRPWGQSGGMFGGQSNGWATNGMQQQQPSGGMTNWSQPQNYSGGMFGGATNGMQQQPYAYGGQTNWMQPNAAAMSGMQNYGGMFGAGPAQPNTYAAYPGQAESQSALAGGPPPGDAESQGLFDGLFGDDKKNKTTTTFEPYGPQGAAYTKYINEMWQNYTKQGKEGAPSFADESTEALNRMEQLAKGPNNILGSASNAMTGIASGANGISTGGMFGSLYNSPGASPGQFNQMYSNPGVGEGTYRNLLNNNDVSSRQFNQMYNTLDDPGMLSKGFFGNMAKGGMLSAYPGFNPGGSSGGGIGAQSASGDAGSQAGTPGGTPPPGTDPRLGYAGAPNPMVSPNPYRNAALDDAMTRTADQLKAAASASGRYGSSAMGDAFARGLGGVAANFNLNAYNSDMDRTMQAAQAASNESLALKGLGLQAAQGAAGVQQGNAANRLNAASGLAGVQGQNANTRLQAASGAAGIQNQNVQNQLAAAQGLTGVQNQNIANRLGAAGMATDLSNLRYSDAERLASVGGAKEQMTQQQRDYQAKLLEQMRVGIGGLPGAAGTQTTSQPSQSWWQTLLGGAGGLASLFL